MIEKLVKIRTAIKNITPLDCNYWWKSLDTAIVHPNQDLISAPKDFKAINESSLK